MGRKGLTASGITEAFLGAGIAVSSAAEVASRCEARAETPDFGVRIVRMAVMLSKVGIGTANPSQWLASPEYRINANAGGPGEQGVSYS